jgi:hypothetical protein
MFNRRNMPAISLAALVGAIKPPFSAPIGLHLPDGPKQPKTSKKYPHSSTRQRARYARQMAAGQLSYYNHKPTLAEQD